MERLACPCCRWRTLSERHVWEACPICGWTDDPLQEQDPGAKGGANAASLAEARVNFDKYGACDPPSVRKVRMPGPDDVRHPG